MFSFSKRGRRLAAAALATAVAATLSLGVAGASQAAATGLGNLDPEATGTVTVHKYTEPPTKGNPASGQEQQVPADSEPLEGAVFTAYPIEGIDLTTNDGWDAAKALDASTYDATAGTISGHNLGEGTALDPTDANGAATSGQLGLGAYLFVETTTPSKVTNPAAPFVVTVPLPNQHYVDGTLTPIQGSWNYNIQVYPKNSVTSVTKAVDDSKAHTVGDTITWPVKVTLPQLPEGQSFTKLIINDTFDPALTYTGVTITQGNTTFAANTDYTVTNDGQHYTVEFTPAGLSGLEQGATVTATFSTTVNENINADADGVIPNTAYVNVNDSDQQQTNTPQSNWGGLAIHKYAQGDNTKNLADAEFDVALANVSPQTNVAHIVTGNNGQIASATDADGNTLPVTNGHIALKAGSYSLVETQAPAGYEPRTDHISATVETGKVTDAAAIDIENTQKPAVELPITGGVGTLIFTLAGLALIGGATGIYIRSRRSRA